MPIATQPAEESLARAKIALIDAANAIDPLAPMRRRPFISVGVAAGIGAVLGMSQGRLIASTNLTQAIASFVRPIAFAIGKYAVARAGGAATQVHDEPARTPAAAE